jgi:hypothetical protein
MIYIDFVGGMHGNYLEFVCNAIIAEIPVDGLPFNQKGAAHKKKYLSPIRFKSGHFFSDPEELDKFKNEQIISIQITDDDLLPLSMISILRAGDMNISNDQLEINTYHKLNNSIYKDSLKNIIDNFFNGQVQESYNAVKDPAWPAVENIADFKNLPNWIQDECRSQHNLQLLELTPETPDCPRQVLREFFKLSFKYPEQSGFMSQQHKMTYDTSNSIHIFPFGNFYNLDQFIIEISKIAEWSGFKFTQVEKLISVHKEFLLRQPYKNAKSKCDEIINNIINRTPNCILPKLDLMEESYINAKLELYYNKEMPTHNNLWFRTYEEICQYIE